LIGVPKSRIGQYGLLTAAVLLTRIPFRSRLLYDLDSVNFATGMERFDVTVFQPHAPGYYLYIVLGRLFSLALPEANDALVAVSVLFSCLAAIAIHRLTEDLYDRNAAFAAGFIFVFSPLFWFHGTVALIYVVEGFFSALVGWLCWQTYSGKRDRSLMSAAALGLSIGFRQSSCLFLGPLWLFSLSEKPKGAMVKSAGVLALVCAAWFAPMAVESGGPAAYFQGLYDLWTAVAGQRTAFTSTEVGGVWLVFARSVAILVIFAMTFGFFPVRAVAQAAMWGRGQQATERNVERSLYYLVWLVPGLLFFTFIYLNYVNSGYLLVLTPPLFAWLGNAAWTGSGFARPRARAIHLITLAALNTLIFLYSPMYCSRRSVLEFEREWTRTVAFVRATYDPKTTVLIGLDAHFHGFRHASYYLPEYHIFAYPNTRVAGQVRLLTAHNRDSRMTAPPDSLAPLEQVVFLPMPLDDENVGYFKAIVAATSDIRETLTDDRIGAAGPISSFKTIYSAAYAGTSGEASR
jgi:hypothetical protein